MIYRFLAYIKARDGEYVPFSFQGKNTFLGKEENYKARVYSKAQDALRYEKWTESWIKTGKNLSYAHKAMNCAGNLVFKNQQIDFQNRINPENKAYRPDAARVLYKFTKARMVRMRLLPSLAQRVCHEKSGYVSLRTAITSLILRAPSLFMVCMLWS